MDARHPAAAAGRPPSCTSTRGAEPPSTIRPRNRREARHLAERYGLEFVDLEHFRIDHELFRSIPADLMLRYGFVPYRRDGRALVIVVSDPSDLPMIDELEVLLATPLRVMVGPRSAIESILKKSESSQRVLEEATEGFQIQLLKDEDERRREPDGRAADERHQPDDPAGGLDDLHGHPAARVSDIHIETQDDAVVREVPDRRRAAGRRCGRSPSSSTARSSRASRSWPSSTSPRSACRRTAASSCACRARRSTSASRSCRACTARTRSSASSTRSRSASSSASCASTSSGFPEAELRRFRKYIAEPYGMVLVTGPDRQRQDDHALRGAVRDQVARRQDHHHRGPGRVPAEGHHADSRSTRRRG